MRLVMTEAKQESAAVHTVADALEELRRIAEAGAAGAFGRQVARAAQMVAGALDRHRKVLTCGNGGSAAQASHLAEELLGRYKKDRGPLAAICLCSDGPALTCIANDFGFDEIFSRQVDALGREGDLLIAFTTSGRSENVNRALNMARARGLENLVIAGQDSGKSGTLADLCVCVPSANSARIQEMHTFVIHAICEECDRRAAGQP
jgi:D-sedoheptulose 7-phosphate isomerase